MKMYTEGVLVVGMSEIEGKKPYQNSGIETGDKIIEVNNILEYIKNKTNSYIITLEIKGNELTSEEFSKKIKEIENDGHYNEILFLVGNAEGLDREVCKKANFKFSLSKLTFLHQEAVLILIEQIYRAFKILNNEPYHK